MKSNHAPDGAIRTPGKNRQFLNKTADLSSPRDT
jgi:hypothetical protein